MQVGSQGLQSIELVARQAKAAGGGGTSGMPTRGVAAVAARPVGPEKATTALPAPEAVAEEPGDSVSVAAAAPSDDAALMALSSEWGLPPVSAGFFRRAQFARAMAGMPGDDAFIGVVRASYPLAGAINAANGGDALAAALNQPLAFSTVPEPATWFTLVAGMALVGFSLRRRNRLPTVSN